MKGGWKMGALITDQSDQSDQSEHSEYSDVGTYSTM